MNIKEGNKAKQKETEIRECKGEGRQKETGNGEIKEKERRRENWRKESRKLFKKKKKERVSCFYFLSTSAGPE